MTWNILHGGGSRRIPGIALEILAHRPDIVAITESRRAFAGQLAGALADGGLVHSISTDPPAGINGVLLASRLELRRAGSSPPDCLRHRWLEAELPSERLTVAAAHLAEAGKRREHASGWKHLLDRARARREEAFVIAGDLNTWRDGPTHRRRTGASATNLGRLSALGYADAWLEAGDGSRGSTWSGRGSGYRLDYVLLSATLRRSMAGATTARPEPGDRLSDHLPVIAELALDGEKPCE